MPFIERNTRSVADSDSLGLKCTSGGLTLAGVPLLHKTATGWIPRSAGEIGALMKMAYGQAVDPAELTPGLNVVAQALNGGDLGRAMVAAVRLRLPHVSRDRAELLVGGVGALEKYNPDEPRDARGRWTTGGGDVAVTAAQSGAGKPANGASLMSPIPVASKGNLSFGSRAELICNIATRNCQKNAMDRGAPYFPKCWEAQDACDLTVSASKLDPVQPFFVLYPDKTVVFIQNGNAAIIYNGGAKLGTPLR